MSAQGSTDSWIESSRNGICTYDAGICGNCLKHLDSDCGCTDEEREEGYTLQERHENYYADLGERWYQESLEEKL